jgi:hypothetical protein
LKGQHLHGAVHTELKALRQLVPLAAQPGVVLCITPEVALVCSVDTTAMQRSAHSCVNEAYRMRLPSGHVSAD